jgi:hypothetical protein
MFGFLIFGLHLQFLQNFITTDLVTLIIVLINFRFVNSDGIVSLCQDFKIEQLHVLLTNRMAVWYNDVCSLLQQSIVNTTTLINIFALADQTLQFHTTNLSLTLLTPKQNKTKDFLLSLLLISSKTAPFPPQRYSYVCIFGESKRVLVIFGPL